MNNTQKNPKWHEVRAKALEHFEKGETGQAEDLLNAAERGDARIAAEDWYRRQRGWLQAAEVEGLLADSKYCAPYSTDVIELWWKHASAMRNAGRFDLSRRLLARLLGERDDLLVDRTPADEARAQQAHQELDDTTYVCLVQKLALSTYKDADLHPRL